MPRSHVAHRNCVVHTHRNCVAHIQPCCSRTISIWKMARPFDHFSACLDETGRFRGVFPKVVRFLKKSEMGDKGSFLVFWDDFLRFLVFVWGWCWIILGCIGHKIALVGCSFRLISYVFKISRFGPISHFYSMWGVLFGIDIEMIWNCIGLILDWFGIGFEEDLVY